MRVEGIRVQMPVLEDLVPAYFLRVQREVVVLVSGRPQKEQRGPLHRPSVKVRRQQGFVAISSLVKLSRLKG